MSTDDAIDAERRRHALLANLRQELLAPVGAILGYGEILHEEVAARGPDEIAADIERILSAARDLFAMVDRLLDSASAGKLFAGEDGAAVQQKLRHDLRTPINAIKGYGEMLLEDLQELGAERLRADLEAMLGQSNQLLAQLAGIVDFSRLDATGTDDGAPKAAAMIGELVKSIRPVGETADRPPETGRILVVDDLEANRDLLTRRLGRDGHSVAAAESGRGALDRMAAEDFDLVLLDLMMPDMNGFEVLERLKADPRLHDVPVIMISALDEIASVVRCIEAGAEDYLPKPFNPVLLKARISACLEKRRWRLRERLYLDRLKSEKEKFERLLLNVLPRQIVSRLNSGETIIADRFEDVSVLFSDLVGFTEISSRMPPRQLVEQLNTLFSRFDDHASALGVEKIKMIGDAYMVVAGAPEPRADHARAIAEMALRMMRTVTRQTRDLGTPFWARIGIDSGPVVAGIIGTHRFLYDVWGDTVNVASRLEQLSPAGRVQVSERTARLLADSFELEARGTINVKGKGQLKTFFLTGPGQSKVTRTKLAAI